VQEQSSETAWINIELWDDARFQSLSDSAQLLWIYFLTSSAYPMPGLLSANEETVAARLGWDTDRVLTAFAELIEKGSASCGTSPPRLGCAIPRCSCGPGTTREERLASPEHRTAARTHLAEVLGRRRQVAGRFGVRVRRPRRGPTADAALYSFLGYAEFLLKLGDVDSALIASVLYGQNDQRDNRLRQTRFALKRIDAAWANFCRSR
jgi:hypothetical protein